MRMLVCLIAAVTLASTAHAQDPPSIKAALEAMAARDQAGRTRLIERGKRDGLPLNAPQYADLRKRQRGIDFRNQAQLNAIVKRSGWPSLQVVGPVAATGAFRVVQHAKLEYQKRYLPLIREAVAKGQADASELAILEDAVRVAQHQGPASSTR